MRGDWKAFWQALPADVDFYHRDDFSWDYPMLGTGGEMEVKLPVIMKSDAGEEPTVFISSEELDAMKSLEELMKRIEQGLASKPQTTRISRAFA